MEGIISDYLVKDENGKCFWFGEDSFNELYMPDDGRYPDLKPCEVDSKLHDELNSLKCKHKEEMVELQKELKNANAEIVRLNMQLKIAEGQLDMVHLIFGSDVMQ